MWKQENTRVQSFNTDDFLYPPGYIVHVGKGNFEAYYNHELIACGVSEYDAKTEVQKAYSQAKGE